MKHLLEHITTLSSGIYSQPDIIADTMYLQANHFTEKGFFDVSTKPQLKLTEKNVKHLLKNDDILFAAKGLNNFAVVYHNSIGRAVASSSFIIIRIVDDFKTKLIPEYLAWCLNNHKQVAVLHQLKTTTTIPSISIAQLSQLEIHIPDIQKQQQVLKIQELYNREQQVEKKIMHLKKIQLQEILLQAIKK